MDVKGSHLHGFLLSLLLIGVEGVESSELWLNLRELRLNLRELWLKLSELRLQSY
jgi:hypothetical protein